MRTLGVIGVLVTFFGSVNLAAAHNNTIVHRRMGEESVSSLGNPFYDGFTFDVAEGSDKEDVPVTRSLGHFYNPETDSAPWFAVGSGPAWENAQEQFDAGLSEYAGGNYSGTDGAYHRIGRALHFIQDMTSVAHVHDDQHATDPEDFEDWGPANFDSFDYSSVEPKYAVDRTAAGFVKEIARLVYDLTIYPAELDAYDGCPAECQPPSLLRDMFPSLHYEDGGLFDGDTWVIDRIGSTDTFGGLSDGWWIVDENRVEDSGGRNGTSRVIGGAYVENTGGDGGDPIPLVFNGVPNTASETMLELYGRLLYPEAIAYGAGLLQVFAEDVLGATPTPTPSPTPSASVTPSPTPDPTPSPDPTPTPDPTASPPPVAVCEAEPRLDCRTSTKPRGTRLIFKNSSNDDKDVATLRMTSLQETTIQALGDPFLGHTAYGVCFYEDIAGVSSLTAQAEIPGSGFCKGKACWKRLPKSKGFVYKDPDLTPDGILKVLLKTGAEGKAKLLVKAKGDRVSIPDGPLGQDPDVTVQVVNSDGECWSGAFRVPAFQNDAAGFRDFSD